MLYKNCTQQQAGLMSAAPPRAQPGHVCFGIMGVWGATVEQHLQVLL